MARHVAVYRRLLALYPRSFRREYAGELVRVFDDLIAHCGPSRAWRRTVVDLLVTVPRYRLESLMSPRRADTTLYSVTAVVSVLAVLGVTTGFFAGGVVLALAAVLLLFVSGSRLARANRPPDGRRRRRLLVASGVLAGTWLIATVAMWIELADDASWHGGKLVLYNAVFFVTALSAVVCLVVGVRTPHPPVEPTVANAR